MDDQMNHSSMSLLGLPAELIEHIVDFLDDVSFCQARRAHRCFVVRDHAHVLAGRARRHWLGHTFYRVCRHGPPDAVIAHLDAGSKVSSDHLICAAKYDNAPAIDLICQRFALDSRDWSTRFADTAGSLGNVRALEVLARFGFRASRSALHGAAFSGRRPRWHALVALHKLGLGDWGPWLMDAAAQEGRCKLVRFLHKHLGQSCTTDAMDEAAARGYLKIVRFIHDNRTEGCTTEAMDGAAANGHWDIVQLLHANRSEGCTTKAMDDAAAGGHIKVVQFLHDNRHEGCTSAAMDRAAAAGHLDVVAFLAENRTEGNPTTAKHMAGQTRQADVVTYLRRRWPKPPRQRKRRHNADTPTTTKVP
ncbi:ankyrin repeat protein [Pandoravirus inopinatum]|uniref:Ankyrin repeat protein n=1 Tax=Pandoravirus inopinatum TaxID=1605721 RepID=A0A0B5JCZ0_9VIRU|nr:ankyrin repeat protein [Pandoravirus inopinatum]AJF97547.1 ankyrin repeat protein [Pandoravirus inopinatum]